MATVVDTFLSQYHSEKDEAKRFNLLSDFVNLYYDSNFFKINPILEAELERCIKHKITDGEALVRFMLAFSAFETGDIKTGQVEMEKVMSMFDKVKSHDVRSQIFNFLAFSSSHQGNMEQAFKYVYECIRESELSLSIRNRHWGVYTLGVLYYDLKDFENSEKYYTEAAQGFTKNNNDYGVARAETGLSSIYIQYARYDEAEKMLNRSLRFYKEHGVLSGQSRSLNDLGLIYKKTGRYDMALDCLKQALHIRRETNHAQGVATSLNEIAELLLLQNKYNEAENYLKEARVACEKINNRGKLFRTHKMFSQLYKAIGEPLKALEHHELYDVLKTEVQGEAASNKIKELQTRMATEKAEKEAEIERLRNVELKEAYSIIEKKNKEITDSIRYAEKIQYALLAHDDLLNKYLPEHFILYLPKDIVSGDFYWGANLVKGSKFKVQDSVSNEKTESTELFFLAVCDSTGHGVPGAFMSLLNSNYLNEAINEKDIKEPGQIFDHVRKRLIENVSKEDQKDGMDGILCQFNIQNSTFRIKYAAAHNAPMLVSDSKIKELAYDKMPVGKGYTTDCFNTFMLELKKGDMLYLITDGYADQFGGAQGKKFMKKQLKELLLSVSYKPLDEQKAILIGTFEKWKGSMEQVDDICIIGIKF